MIYLSEDVKKENIDSYDAYDFSEDLLYSLKTYNSQISTIRDNSVKVKNNIRKTIENLDLTLSLFLEAISKSENDITRYGIYNNEYFFQLLKNLKAKFSNRSCQCDIEFILVFFSNFRKYYQKLVVNFTEYIVAKYIHNISFNKAFNLKVNLLTFNHLLRERIYARNQKFRYIN